MPMNTTPGVREQHHEKTEAELEADAEAARIRNEYVPFPIPD